MRNIILDWIIDLKKIQNGRLRITNECYTYKLWKLTDAKNLGGKTGFIQ